MPEARDGKNFWSEHHLSANATGKMDEALATRLEPTEQVAYRLTSDGGVVHELHDETRERGGGTLCAVTDRKLVFVVDAGSGIETADVPYEELTNVEVKSGFLRTNLAVQVWGHGTLRFNPDDSSTAEAVVRFVTDAIDWWQNAVAALQDAKQHGTELTRHIEAENREAAADARRSVSENLTAAKDAADAANGVVKTPIEERIARVEVELARARMEVHFDRGRALAPTAFNLAMAARYDEAQESLERARRHVDTAFEIAQERGFSDRNRVRSLRNFLEEEAEELGSKPLERAEQALARAREAAGDHNSLREWEHALSCYRDALTAGWGTDTYEGDTDSLRMEIEWLVAQVIDYRRSLADRYEAEGNTFEALDAHTVTLDRYESACAHLATAARLAAEYQAGNAENIRERCWWVATKLEDF